MSICVSRAARYGNERIALAGLARHWAQLRGRAKYVVPGGWSSLRKSQTGEAGLRSARGPTLASVPHKCSASDAWCPPDTRASARGQSFDGVLESQTLADLRPGIKRLIQNTGGRLSKHVRPAQLAERMRVVQTRCSPIAFHGLCKDSQRFSMGGVARMTRRSWSVMLNFKLAQPSCRAPNGDRPWPARVTICG